MGDQLELDHLVYFVPSLAEAIVEFQNCLGVAPHEGGRHEGMGTHNAILPLAGTKYVELIAKDPTAPTPNQPRPFGLDALTAPRLITWAARTSDIDAATARSRNAGYDPGIILPMSRKEPGGAELRWKLSLPTSPESMIGDGLVPFIIDWGNTPHPAHATSNGEPQCELVSFAGCHIKPDPVVVALAALGAELKVASGTAPGLRAELRGPAGSLVLD
ncbi:MAG: hypothetical protein ACI8W3_000081 [Myxococcota bacterium]